MDVDSMRSQTEPNTVPEWSSGAMLLLGTMGTQTAAEKRYYRRCLLLLPLWLLWCTWVGWPDHIAAPQWQKRLADLLPGLMMLYTVWELRRYLMSLDELARKLQYESIAWTYLIGLVLWAFLLGVFATENWSLGPTMIGLFIGLEGLRATMLYFFARRYR